MAMKWNGPLFELPSRLKVVIGEQVASGDLKHPDLVSVYGESIEEVVTELYEAFSDGFDLSDLGVVGEAVAELVDIVDDAGDLDAKGLEQLAGDFALIIYKIWDPNIPVLWESAENTLEAPALHAAAAMAVKGLLRLLRKHKNKPLAEEAEPPVTDAELGGDSGEDLGALGE